MQSVSNQNTQTKSLNDFTLILCLGKGSYAKVVLVREKQTKKIFAMKIMKKNYIKKQGQEEHIANERNVLVRVRHPFIIKLVYSFQDRDKLYFVMEYAQGGELFNLLQRAGKFNEDQTRFYAAQIVLALEALHNQDIIYRDLKPENVLLDDKGYIKIADFGLSKSQVRGNKDAHSVCGTPEYLAPEILLRGGHGKAIDYWAIGAIIYEMLTGLPPFYCEDRDELFERIKYKDLAFPQNLTLPCLDLLTGLFQKDPAKRLGSVGGMTQIKNHPWFVNINWDILLQKLYRPVYKPFITSEVSTENFSPDFTQDTEVFSVQDSMANNTVNKKYDGFTYTATQTEDTKMEME